MPKTVPENWVSKQSFFVLILTTKFHETSQNFNSIRQPIEKKEKSNCLNKLNELNFCKVSWNSISNRYWKFQLSFLKNKKVLFLKKYSLSRTAKIDPKDGVSRPNFPWRFWLKPQMMNAKASRLTSIALSACVILTVHWGQSIFEEPIKE